jgi:hypothetical protein
VDLYCRGWTKATRFRDANSVSSAKTSRFRDAKFTEMQTQLAAPRQAGSRDAKFTEMKFS